MHVMYALDGQIAAIRAQESKSDDEAAHFGLSLGLGANPLQPLTIRANMGDCVQVGFTNQLGRPATFHIQGWDFVLSGTGQPALSTNPDAIALPGQTMNYEWYLDPDYYGENTHYLRSHGPKIRYLVSHGLFGAIIVEPVRS